MSDENIAAVRRLTQEGFVGGKVDVVDDVVAENCVDHDPHARSGPRSRRTAPHLPDGGRRPLEPEHTAGRLLGRRRHGDRELDLPGNPHRRLPRRSRHREAAPGAGHRDLAARDGKIVERWGVVDAAGVMEQLGVMTNHRRTHRPTLSVVQRLSRRFAGVFEHPDSAKDVFASDAFFDLNMPVWRFQLQGAEAFAAQLDAINEGDVRIDVLRTVPTASGFVTEHEEHQAVDGQDLTARRLWLCEVQRRPDRRGRRLLQRRVGRSSDRTRPKPP